MGEFLYTVGRTESYAPFVGRPDHIKCQGGIAFETPEEARAWLAQGVVRHFPKRTPDEFSVYEMMRVPTVPSPDGLDFCIATDTRILRLVP